jgi:hypothetical protein
VVNLVEDHEGLGRLGELAVQCRAHGDLCIGDDDAVEAATTERLAVAVLGIEPDAGAMGGVRPLAFQVLGGRDNGNAIDGSTCQQFGREAQRERRLAGAGSGGGEKVAGLRLEVADTPATDRPPVDGFG